MSDVETLLASDEHFLLGRWLEDAKTLATNDAEKQLYEYNARNQLTLWGPTDGNILDYANKQWSGLVKSYYQPRWALIVEQLVWSIIYKAPFDEGQFNKDLFNKVEQPFTFDCTLWPTEQTGDTAYLAKHIHKTYSPATVENSKFFARLRDLFVQAALQTAAKLHPCLKYRVEKKDLDDLFDIIEAPLRKHADLARSSIMSVPPKFFFHKEDLDKFHFDETDRNCGFLVASMRPHPRMKTGTCSGWEFSHATLHEFFSAVGMLRSDDSVWEKLEEDTLVEQLKTMLMFVGGLVGDPSYEYYVERLVLGDGQLNTQQSVERLREWMLKKITVSKLRIYMLSYCVAALRGERLHKLKQQ